MKTVKRVFAIAVAVLLVAMMIPSAFAANTVNWELNLPGFKYEVYKVADYNSTTGTFSTTYSEIQSEVTANTDDTAALARKCANINFDGVDPVATFTSSVTDTADDFEVGDGIFYIKLAEVTNPDYADTVTQESVVVFPQKNGNTSTDVLNLATKLKKGNEPDVDKFFLVGTEETKDDQSFGSVTDTVITYTLHAELPKAPVTNFIIVDKMGDGLNKSVHNVTGVELKDKKGNVLNDSVAYTAAAASEINVDGHNGTSTSGNTFGVKITSPENLDYTEGNYICVTYTTSLGSDAQINTAIPNHDALIYGNEFLNVVDGKTVNAYTYAAQAVKVDATSTTTKLGGATFELYAEDKSTLIDTAETAKSGDDLGIAKFTAKLAAGTYYVKEVSAPEGYNLNTSWSDALTVGPDTPTGSVTITDTKAKMPSTGGTGTMVFTIVGGSLVLLAAALFVVVMKKRSSAK